MSAAASVSQVSTLSDLDLLTLNPAHTHTNRQTTSVHIEKLLKENYSPKSNELIPLLKSMQVLTDSSLVGILPR
jgi:hypothetical protein